jgi:hypothetical protein
MNDRVRVLIVDDIEYEDLIAEIQIDGDCVAILTQEQGELKIEFDHSSVWSEGRKEIPLPSSCEPSNRLRPVSGR